MWSPYRWTEGEQPLKIGHGDRDPVRPRRERVHVRWRLEKIDDPAIRTRFTQLVLVQGDVQPQVVERRVVVVSIAASHHGRSAFSRTVCKAEPPGPAKRLSGHRRRR